MNAGRDRAASQGSAPVGRRILIIDDETGIHLSLERILGRQGHEVEGVLRAAEGVEKLERGHYDLVISDLMMPDMDGIQLLQRVRELGLSVPVLMITGYPSMRTAVQALRLGAVDYLAKPFTRQELLGPVNRILRAGGEGAEAEETPEEAGSAALGLGEGQRFRLRKHSWAIYQEDGSVQVGIEPSFLEGVGVITGLEIPEEADLVEQGFAGIRLQTADDEEHGVFMPLSGRVVSVNEEALATPGSVDGETWLIQIVPSDLSSELPLLLRGQGAS